EGPTLVDGHQLVAQIVVWRGERNREMWTVRHLCEIQNSRNDASGGDRNSIRHNVEAVRIRHDAQSFQERVEVQKRLARAHADEIRAAWRFDAGSVSVVEYDEYLFDDLAGG